MNVSMQDAFNLGWKLAAVLRGRCAPTLLQTYSAERQVIAKELIDFDREWAKMLSTPLKHAPDGEGIDPAEVQRYFVRHGHYTAGTATRYKPSLHDRRAAPSASGHRVRARHALPFGAGHSSGGRQTRSPWRYDQSRRPVASCSPSPTGRLFGNVLACARCAGFWPAPRVSGAQIHAGRADIDSVIDVRAVFQQGYRELDIGAMPLLLLPRKAGSGCAITRRCSVRT